MQRYRRLLILLLPLALALAAPALAAAAPAGQSGAGLPGIDVVVGGGSAANDPGTSLSILAVFTLITLAPSLLIMMTGFTRILIVMSFLRNALGTQQMPPNQVLVGF